IIKTGPNKRAREPWTVGEETPPTFGGRGPARPDDVVSADVTTRLVVRVNAARTNDAGLFGANVRLVRMLGMILVHLRTVVIIPAADFDGADASTTQTFFNAE